MTRTSTRPRRLRARRSRRAKKNSFRLTIHENKQTNLISRRYKGDVGEMEELLAQGLDVNILGAQDRTPLHRAVGGKSTTATTFLIERGAGVNLEDNAGRTPMHWAAIVGSPECGEILKANQGSINPLTKTGKTPLHMSAEAGHLTFVQFIVKSGADTTVKDGKGLTAFDLAKKEGHKDVMALVKPAGSKKGGGCLIM